MTKSHGKLVAVKLQASPSDSPLPPTDLCGGREKGGVCVYARASTRVLTQTS